MSKVIRPRKANATRFRSPHVPERCSTPRFNAALSGYSSGFKFCTYRTVAIMKNFGGVFFLFRQGQRAGNTAELSGFPLSFINPSERSYESTANYPEKSNWHAV